MGLSRVERLLKYLRSQPRGRARLSDVVSEFGWDEALVDRVIAESDGRIGRANMGGARGVKQLGYEIGSGAKVPLYVDVRRVLATTWAKARGWQAAMVLDTAVRGKASTGVWSRPDCVVAYYPARRRTLQDPPTLASYEIEARRKFDIRSVYEAHAHGAGADFSWVLFCRDPLAEGSPPAADWQRVLWAAGICGIGLISVGKPGDASTWRVELGAARRGDGARQEFVARAIPASMREMAGLPIADMKRRNRSGERVITSPPSST